MKGSQFINHVAETIVTLTLRNDVLLRSEATQEAVNDAIADDHMYPLDICYGCKLIIYNPSDSECEYCNVCDKLIHCGRKEVCKETPYACDTCNFEICDQCVKLCTVCDDYICKNCALECEHFDCLNAVCAACSNRCDRCAHELCHSCVSEHMRAVHLKTQ